MGARVRPSSMGRGTSAKAPPAQFTRAPPASGAQPWRHNHEKHAHRPPPAPMQMPQSTLSHAKLHANRDVHGRPGANEGLKFECA